jgi:hypothetical protein
LNEEEASPPTPSPQGEGALSERKCVCFTNKKNPLEDVELFLPLLLERVGVRLLVLSERKCVSASPTKKIPLEDVELFLPLLLERVGVRLFVGHSE